MMSPIAKVFDNQSTSSSVLISLGGTAFVLAALAGFMLFGGMTFIAAVFVTVIASLTFAVACALFAAVAAPLAAVVLIPLFAVGSILLGLFVIVGGFFAGLFNLPFFGNKPD